MKTDRFSGAGALRHHGANRSQHRSLRGPGPGKWLRLRRSARTSWLMCWSTVAMSRIVPVQPKHVRRRKGILPTVCCFCESYCNRHTCRRPHPERTGVTAVGRQVPDRVRRRSWVAVSRPWLLTLSRGWPVAAPVRGRPGPARPGPPRLRSSSAKLTLSRVPGKCARSVGRLSVRMHARCCRCRRCRCPCRSAVRRRGGRGSPALRSAGR